MKKLLKRLRLIALATAGLMLVSMALTTSNTSAFDYAYHSFGLAMFVYGGLLMAYSFFVK